MERGKAVVNTFNRYQAAEYTTCINRCRTAKQWLDFTSDPERNKLFPNLKWLESRSADQREEHQVFYDLILSKDDPFWIENQPGQLWNCKCDWEETDEPASPSAPESVKPAAGLEGNPAITGELFTEKAGYFQGLSEEMSKAIRESYNSIWASEYKMSLRELYNTTTKFERFSVNYNSDGIGHIINDLKVKNVVFLKNETFLFLESFLKEYKSLQIKQNNKPKDSKKQNKPMWYYFQLNVFNSELYYVVYQTTEKKMVLYSVTDQLP